MVAQTEQAIYKQMNYIDNRTIFVCQEQEISDVLSKEGVSDSRITEMKRIMDNTVER